MEQLMGNYHNVILIQMKFVICPINGFNPIYLGPLCNMNRKINEIHDEIQQNLIQNIMCRTLTS